MIGYYESFKKSFTIFCANSIKEIFQSFVDLMFWTNKQEVQSDIF